jgi:hypothetical protein
MSKNRRDFIKATAVAGLVGISDASAKTPSHDTRQKTDLNKRPRKRAGAPPAAPTKILVVSMIPFSGTPFEGQFLAGCNITLPDPNYSVLDNAGKGLGYNDSDLQNAIKSADASTLVVTVGGLAAAKAANTVGTKRFISLVGDTYWLSK